MQIIVFPHAGGSRSYYMPMKKLEKYGAGVRLYEYAGRGSKYGEPFYSEQSDAVARIYRELFPHGAAEDCMLFGHSMGAIIAYEIAAEMVRREEDAHLRGLLVSASCPPADVKSVQFDIDDDTQLWSYIESLGGVDPRLQEYPEMMEIILRACRADFHLVDSYHYLPLKKPISAPVELFYSAGDHTLPEHPVLERWAEVTEDFRGCREFTGDHFYLQEHWEDLIRCIGEFMADVVNAA